MAVICIAYLALGDSLPAKVGEVVRLTLQVWTDSNPELDLSASPEYETEFTQHIVYPTSFALRTSQGVGPERHSHTASN